MSHASASLLELEPTQIHTRKNRHLEPEFKGRPAVVLFRDRAHELATLQAQARLLLSEIQESCEHSGKYLVRFVAGGCNPGSARVIANAFSMASAISCGSTLHICCQSGNKDNNAWKGLKAIPYSQRNTLDLIGPDAAIEELHRASFWGTNCLDLNDKTCVGKDGASISTSDFATITIDQSGHSTSVRLARSSSRKEVSIVVIESGQSRSSEIRRCIDRLSHSLHEMVAFVFITPSQ